MIDMLLLASGKILHLLGKFTYIFTCNKIYEYFCGSEHTATFSVHFKPFFENFRPLVLKLSFAQNMAVFHSWGLQPGYHGNNMCIENIILFSVTLPSKGYKNI
jgi:hypothetical protein